MLRILHGISASAILSPYRDPQEQKNLDVYRDFLDENGLTAIAAGSSGWLWGMRRGGLAKESCGHLATILGD